jgi:hypothetical protein
MKYSDFPSLLSDSPNLSSAKTSAKLNQLFYLNIVMQPWCATLNNAKISQTIPVKYKQYLCRRYRITKYSLLLDIIWFKVVRILIFEKLSTDLWQKKYNYGIAPIVICKTSLNIFLST